ncbi:hypothetical protein [Terrabacter lapilli]|uniref:hypothetical protein n=1 Tax=Terrabacter lapilli TaxID=436231 RepID=UPI0031D65942
MTTTRPVVPAATSADAPRRPRLRFLLAGLLAIAAGAVAFLLLGVADTAVTASLQSAARGPASGFSATVHPGTYAVFSLEGAAVSDVSVTAPDGGRLAVTPSSEAFTWGPHREGLQVGSFEVPMGAGLTDYRVAATPAAGSGEVTLAVTTFDVVGFNRLVASGAIGILVVNVGVAAALLILWPPRASSGRPGRRPSRPTPAPPEAG